MTTPSTGIRFALLGPVAVRRGGMLVGVRAPMPRTLLAALLLKVNQVVTVERLLDILWGDQPPATAVASLQNHVMRLRAHLAVAGAGRIRAAAPGYLMEVAAGELDVEVFTRLVKLGAQAAVGGDWEVVVAELTAALSLWRGDPLADVASPVLRTTEVPRLSQLYLDAQEARVCAYLQLGRYREAIAELSVLTAAHPLQERFHGQLMLACSRAGRRAEALAAYRRAREILAEELGVDPDVELQQLHQRILTADPTVAAMDAEAAAGRMPGTAGSVAAATAQLPPDTSDFTGRDAQVRLLCDALGSRPDEARPGAVVISAVAGMGGIGKTALAVHTAHRLRGRFPDGQLFADLQGASSPLRPGEVLARFLRDLGTPNAAIPADEAERVARYRTLLTSRRMLIVLDDARDAAQVRPLLPGTAHCAVIVTSRSTLSDLTGATLVRLDVLDSREAHALFTAIAGPQRAAAEPDATASVLACCAGLPLAVRIAGSRLASRPSWSIAHLSTKLSDERARLTEMTAGDLAVRASFAVSYAALPTDGTDPARVFRLLGLPWAAALSLPAIAALTGQPVSDVTLALESLTDAHMVDSLAADRFRLHDLLRSYAAELAESTESTAERKAALARMLRWFGDQAVTAARVLAPGRRLPVITAVSCASPVMTDPAQALDWLETERASLVTAARQAAELGLHEIAAQVAAAMWGFFQRTPHIEDFLVISETGVSSARHLGDDALLSWLLNGLGQVHSLRGHFTDSHRCLTEALNIRQRTGDRTGAAAVLNSLALDLYWQERFEDALDYLRPALAIHTALGDRPFAADILSNIGETLLRLKRHDEALGHLRQALAIRRETSDRYGQGTTERALGDTYLDLSHFEDAVDHYQRALAALEGTARDHTDQADILCGLGRALDSLGRTREARDAWHAAIPILDRNNDPRAAELRHRSGTDGSRTPAG